MKKLTKILAMLLIMSCLIFTVACGLGSDSEGGGNTSEHEHVGATECVQCGLDYFSTLSSLIVEKGRPGASYGVYVYDGKVISQSGETLTTAVTYDAGDMMIQLVAIYDVGIVDYTMLIHIPHPNKGDALKNKQYTWLCGMSNCEALGILDAITFNEYTSSLTETVNDGFNNDVISSARGMFAFLAKYAIKDAFVPLLELDDNGLTPKLFGFYNFET